MSVVTIISGTFCGGEEVAQGVAESLGGKLVRDEDLIGRAAKEGKLSNEALRRAMFGRPSMFNQFSHEKERAVSRLKLALAQLLSEEEKLVILGLVSRLAPSTISHVMRVCLIAETNYRLTHAARELGLSEREALARVHKDDESAIRWAEFVNGGDPWAAENYDLLLPMETRPPAEAVEKIRQHASGPALSPCESSRAAAREFLLAAEAESALAEAGHTCREIGVTAQGKDLTVLVNRKVVRLSKLADQLKEIVARVPGAGEIRVEAGPEFYQADVYRGVDFKLPSKVLLVDDEREFAETLSERLMLREIGSAVAYDGEQALRMVAEDEPEVLVLDLKMPGVDGFEVLRRIKRDYPRVEVIILTGHGSQRDRDVCLQLGAFAYLEKPVDVDELSKAMQEAYNKVRGEAE